MQKKLQTVNHSCGVNIKEKSVDCVSRQLEDVPQDLNPDIETLYLRFNHLTTLWNSSFQRYSQLIRLDLSWNSLYWTERDAFYPLVKLRDLTLSDNPGIQLHPDSFQRSWKLQYLYLSSCYLSSFALQKNELGAGIKDIDGMINQGFPSLSQLEIAVIDLDRNDFRIINPETIAIDYNVGSLTLNENPLEIVDPDTIASLHGKLLDFSYRPLPLEVIKNITLGASKSAVIKTLYFKFTEITHIPRDLFEHLRNKNLSSLSLYGNKFIFYPGVFKDLRYVHTLSITYCGLTIMDPRYFDGMKGLRVLDASRNPIRSINPNMTRWSVDLYEMKISLEQCMSIKENAFNGLQNLTKLALRIESFHTDEVELIVSIANLQHFDLILYFDRPPSTLTLKTPHLKVFRYWSSHVFEGFGIEITRQLSKVAHSIEIVVLHADLSVRDLYPGWYTNHSVFCDMPKLIHLDLSENKFTDLPSLAFINLPSLKSLNLCENEIQIIEPDAIIGLPSLQDLDLRKNELTFLPGDFMSNIPYLINLYLDSNDLSYLDKDLFVAATTLVNLTLAKNKLVGFNRSTFEPLSSSIKSIDISENNIVCNCEMKWLIELFGESLIHGAETLCSTSPATVEPLRGKPIVMFNVRKYCGLDSWIYFAIAAVLVLFAMSVIFIICYFNRWFLRYRLFLLKLTILGYKEI